MLISLPGTGLWMQASCEPLSDLDGASSCTRPPLSPSLSSACRASGALGLRKLLASRYSGPSERSWKMSTVKKLHGFQKCLHQKLFLLEGQIHRECTGRRAGSSAGEVPPQAAAARAEPSGARSLLCLPCGYGIPWLLPICCFFPR